MPITLVQDWNFYRASLFVWPSATLRVETPHFHIRITYAPNKGSAIDWWQECHQRMPLKEKNDLNVWFALQRQCCVCEQFSRGAEQRRWINQAVGQVNLFFCLLEGWPKISNWRENQQTYPKSDKEQSIDDPDQNSEWDRSEQQDGLWEVSNKYYVPV